MTSAVQNFFNSWQVVPLLVNPVRKGTIYFFSYITTLISEVFYDQLVEKYKNIPVEFTNVTLVTLAEETSIDEAFSLDVKGANIYSVYGNKTFSLLPGLSCSLLLLCNHHIHDPDVLCACFVRQRGL